MNSSGKNSNNSTWDSVNFESNLKSGYQEKLLDNKQSQLHALRVENFMNSLPKSITSDKNLRKDLASIMTKCLEAPFNSETFDDLNKKFDKVMEQAKQDPTFSKVMGKLYQDNIGKGTAGVGLIVGGAKLAGELGTALGTIGGGLLLYAIYDSYKKAKGEGTQMESDCQAALSVFKNQLGQQLQENIQAQISASANNVQKIKDVEGKLEATNKDLSNVLTKKEETNKSVDVLEEQVRTARTRKDELSNQISESSSNLKKLKRDIETLKRQAEKLTQSNAQLSEINVALTNSNKELSESNLKLKKNNSQIDFTESVKLGSNPNKVMDSLSQVKVRGGQEGGQVDQSKSVPLNLTDDDQKKTGQSTR